MEYGNANEDKFSFAVRKTSAGRVATITNNQTGNYIDILATHLKSIIGAKRTSGKLPNGSSWKKEGEHITITNDANSFDFRVSELKRPATKFYVDQLIKK